MSEQSVVDADLRMQHAGMDAVGPYLDEAWRLYLGLDEDLSAHSSFRFHLPSSSYSPPPVTSGSAESLREEVRAYLDAHDIGQAVLNPGTAARISGLAYTDASNAIARATNDWLLGEWLAHDHRFLGSIVITPRDPHGAAEEIARVGGDPRIVAVSVAYPQDLIGHRSYLPIFEAAVAHGLVVNLDAGGGFVGVNRGYTGAGHPGSAYEFRVASAIAVHAQLVNLLSEGLFDRFPDLRVTVTGSSIAWLPAVMSIMDSEYRRGDVDAALTRLPGEYLAEFVRFATNPVDWETHNRTADLLSALDASELLVFGSGEERLKPPAVFDRLPAGWRSKVASRNAAQHYQLPQETEASAHG